MKAFTDLEQSKKLAKILPLESADIEYILEQWIDEKTGRHKEGYCEIPVVKVDNDCPLQPITHPCWSLAALLDILPKINNYRLEIRHIDKSYCCCYTEENNCGDLHWYYAYNPVDACVAMIEKLNELKML